MSAIIAAVTGSGFWDIGSKTVPGLTRKTLPEGLISLERQDLIKPNGSVDNGLGATEISGHTPMMQQYFFSMRISWILLNLHCDLYRESFATP
jgi:hypothetical protein